MSSYHKKVSSVSETARLLIKGYHVFYGHGLKMMKLHGRSGLSFVSPTKFEFTLTESKIPDIELSQFRS